MDLPSGRKSIAALALAGAVVVIVVFATRPTEKPTEQIKAALSEAARAAENQDLGGVMEIVSQDFRGDLGGEQAGRSAVQGFLFLQLRRGAWNKVFLTDVDVELGPGPDVTSADVTAHVVLASGANLKTLADVVPERAGTYKITMTMQKEDGDEWRATSAKYTATDVKSLIGVP